MEKRENNSFGSLPGVGPPPTPADIVWLSLAWRWGRWPSPHRSSVPWQSCWRWIWRQVPEFRAGWARAKPGRHTEACEQPHVGGGSKTWNGRNNFQAFSGKNETHFKNETHEKLKVLKSPFYRKFLLETLDPGANFNKCYAWKFRSHPLLRALPSKKGEGGTISVYIWPVLAQGTIQIVCVCY